MNKAQLFAGISVLVMMGGVSGASAQQTRNHSRGEAVWAAPSGVQATSGDHLTLTGGTVTIDHRSNDGGTDDRDAAGKIEIGSVTGGAGTLRLTSDSDRDDVDVTLDSISKQGLRAIDVTLLGVADKQASLTLSVANDAVVRNLSLDRSSDRFRGGDATAVFSGAFTAEGTTEVRAGRNNQGARATLELKKDATFGGHVTLDDNGTAGRAFLVVSGSQNQRIAGGDGNVKVFVGSNGEGTLKVLNGSSVATFGLQVGGNPYNRLGRVIIGEGRTGGHAVFERDVLANEIDLRSSGGATAEFQGSLWGQSIVLADYGENGKATARFNAQNKAITVRPKIFGDNTEAGWGRIVVVGQNSVTFAGQIGADSDPADAEDEAIIGKLREITIGEGANAGHAIFTSHHATNPEVLAEKITVTGGSVAEFHAGLGASGQIARVVLDANGDQKARVKFNATNGQKDIYATFDGQTAGEGDLLIYDDDEGAPETITFKNEIGGANRLAAIFVGQDEGQDFAGSAVFEQGVHTQTLTLSDNARVTFEQPVSVRGDLTLNKGVTITVGDAFGTTRGAFLDVGGVNVTGLTAGDKVTLVLPDDFTAGQRTLFSANVGAGVSKLSLKGHRFYLYTLAADGVVRAEAKLSAKRAAAYGVTREQGLVAESAMKSVKEGSVLAKILTEALENKAEAKKLAEQLVPQSSAVGGATAAVVSAGGQVAGVSSDRLSALRGGGTRHTGFATGGTGLTRAFWLKPFGRWGKQSKAKGFAGFSTASRGLVGGVDAPVGERSRVGAAVAYSTSHVTGKGAGQAKTAVKSWQLSVYGDYTTDRYYVEGQLGFGRNDVKSASKVAILTRRARYGTNQVMASVGGGVPRSVGAGAVVTPTVGLSWTRVGAVDYTTMGALDWNQNISVASLDAVVGALGAKIHKRITQKQGVLSPSARVGVSYDFAGEQMALRGQFTGGGAAFQVKGAKAERLSGTAGFGLSYDGPRWSVGADYDLSARSGFRAHAARLRAKMKF